MRIMGPPPPPYFQVEGQSSAMLKEHEVKRRDLLILKYDKQRALSDEIIQRQRQLIEGKKEASLDCSCQSPLQSFSHNYLVALMPLNDRARAVIREHASTPFFLPRRSDGSQPSATGRRRKPAGRGGRRRGKRRFRPRPKRGRR